ncbi:hypothetical protein F5141DRAFT_1201479 [Pisolithus sp. B1]|nr:hypothetical protein F5141DRAFT_1201479 [Pisolithus sp. B1]
MAVELRKFSLVTDAAQAVNVQILTTPSYFKNRAGLLHYQIHPPSLACFSIHDLQQVGREFTPRNLLKRHGHAGRVRMCPHRGLNLCHVIWHNSTPDLCVLHDALLRGYLNREISRCCHMHFGYPTRLLHVSYVVLLPGETQRSTPSICRAQLLQITSYGVPTNLEYIVWSYPVRIPSFLQSTALEYFFPQASAVVQLLIVIMVQLFFAHKIYRLCRPGVRWLVTAPIILFVLAHYGFGMDLGSSLEKKYYSVTPSAVAVVVAEVLITVSLCVILYDGGSYSACPRAKPLINTITTYAANRCLLTSIVVIAELAVNVDQQALWTMGLNFIVGKLYTNSLLASLNAREHLWSQGSTSMSILNISSLRFADPPTLPKDRRKSQVGERQFNVREAADTWSGV